MGEKESGRNIRSVEFIEGGFAKVEAEGRMKYLSDYLGDHSEEWILIFNESGEEIRRYSIRSIATIEWWLK